MRVAIPLTRVNCYVVLVLVLMRLTPALVVADHPLIRSLGVPGWVAVLAGGCVSLVSVIVVRVLVGSLLVSMGFEAMDGVDGMVTTTAILWPSIVTVTAMRVCAHAGVQERARRSGVVRERALTI